MDTKREGLKEYCVVRKLSVLYWKPSGLMGSALDREVMGRAQIRVAFPIVQKFQSNRVIFNYRGYVSKETVVLRRWESITG